jgi:hypothetical protein
MMMVYDRATGRPDSEWKERRRSEFIRPPATEEQRADIERRIGMSLPAVLRAVYGTLANGGFGPGYGLEGIPDDATRSAQDRSADPPRLVLCQWGCGITSELDLHSGEVLRYDSNVEETDPTALLVEAPSVEEWLGRWAAMDDEDALFWDVYGGKPESE